MSFRIKLTAAANEAVKNLHPDAKKTAKASLREIAGNPYAGKELQQELHGFWSDKFLCYRIIYKFRAHEKIIMVYAIGHRKDIYESFTAFLKS